MIMVNRMVMLIMTTVVTDAGDDDDHFEVDYNYIKR